MKQVVFRRWRQLLLLGIVCLVIPQLSIARANSECIENCIEIEPSSVTVEETERVSTDHHLSPLGSNLTPLADWSTEYPFIDAFKTSREWITHSPHAWNTNENQHLDLDAQGWVKSLPSAGSWHQFRSVGTIMFSKMGENYPDGPYVVLYQGDGEIEYGLDAVKNEAQSWPGRDVIDVTPSATGGGIHLEITRTNPNNYIRNIRIIPPGFDANTVDSRAFHPDFLESIEPYGTLRFMDWQRTNWDLNGNVIREPEVEVEMLHPLEDPERDPHLRQGSSSTFEGWAGRSLATDARYSLDTGMPLEIMVDLVNQTNTNPWFTTPHLADNQYIWNMATLVKNSLRSDRVVYIEYTNEAWNTAFGQGTWIEQQGRIKFGWGEDASLARWNWYAERSAEMCDLWKDVWGHESQRVICVISAQASNEYLAEQMLSCELSSRPNCYQNIDALAIAPYFGQHLGDPAYFETVNRWAWSETGIDALFNELNYGNQLPDSDGKANLNDVIENIRLHKAIADQHGLSLIAYEGGQHITALGWIRNVPKIVELFETVNNDWRMASLYNRYLAAWHDEGGELFAHYVSTGDWDQWGAWGAQQHYNEQAPVKLTALEAFAARTPCNWHGCFTGLTEQVWVPIVIGGP